MNYAKIYFKTIAVFVAVFGIGALGFSYPLIMDAFKNESVAKFSLVCGAIAVVLSIYCLTVSYYAIRRYSDKSLEHLNVASTFVMIGILPTLIKRVLPIGTRTDELLCYASSLFISFVVYQVHSVFLRKREDGLTP